MGLDLTPMQREVAAFAFNGGERKDCADALRVSPEALKKHLRAVFDATGSSRWNDLQSLPATQWLSA
jgi:DNA-binding CsgD family transcriptional regulator